MFDVIHVQHVTSPVPGTCGENTLGVPVALPHANCYVSLDTITKAVVVGDNRTSRAAVDVWRCLISHYRVVVAATKKSISEATSPGSIYDVDLTRSWIIVTGRGTNVCMRSLYIATLSAKYTSIVGSAHDVIVIGIQIDAITIAALTNYPAYRAHQ